MDLVGTERRVGLSAGSLWLLGGRAKRHRRRRKRRRRCWLGWHRWRRHLWPLKPVARPAPRESALSTYSNPEYGVTFQYPRNYPLDEGPLDAETVENIAGLRSQAELEGEQPGGVLAATIIVPDDSFPNTTFAGGSLQFAVNRYLAGEGCRNYPVERLGDSGGSTGRKRFKGCCSHGRTATPGTGIRNFSSGITRALRMGLVTSSSCA